MEAEKKTRDMIVETNRDMKWICRTFEGSRSESAGQEREISAGVGAGPRQAAF